MAEDNIVIKENKTLQCNFQNKHFVKIEIADAVIKEELPAEDLAEDHTKLDNTGEESYERYVKLEYTDEVPNSDGQTSIPKVTAMGHRNDLEKELIKERGDTSYGSGIHIPKKKLSTEKIVKLPYTKADSLNNLDNDELNRLASSKGEKYKSDWGNLGKWGLATDGKTNTIIANHLRVKMLNNKTEPASAVSVSQSASSMWKKSGTRSKHIRFGEICKNNDYLSDAHAFQSEPPNSKRSRLQNCQVDYASSLKEMLVSGKTLHTYTGLVSKQIPNNILPESKEFNSSAFKQNQEQNQVISDHAGKTSGIVTTGEISGVNPFDEVGAGENGVLDRVFPRLSQIYAFYPTSTSSETSVVSPMKGMMRYGETSNNIKETTCSTQEISIVENETPQKVVNRLLYCPSNQVYLDEQLVRSRKEMVEKSKLLPRDISSLFSTPGEKEAVFDYNALEVGCLSMPADEHRKSVEINESTDADCEIFSREDDRKFCRELNAEEQRQLLRCVQETEASLKQQRHALDRCSRNIQIIKRLLGV